jgi:hypothetical protein
MKGNFMSEFTTQNFAKGVAYEAAITVVAAVVGTALMVGITAVSEKIKNRKRFAK